MRQILSVVMCLACLPALAERTFVAGDLQLIEERLDSHEIRLNRIEDTIAKIEPDRIPTPAMPERLVSTPIRNVAAATAAVVTAPVRMIRRKVCQNGRCSYVMVPATVTAAPVVVTATPVPVAAPYYSSVRAVQRVGCSGRACSRSRSVVRRGLFGRWR